MFVITKRCAKERLATIKLLCAILLVLAAPTLFARGQTSGYRSAAFVQSDNSIVLVFAIDGMTGPMSAAILRDTIESLEAVERSVVSAQAARATVAFDPNAITPEEIAKRVAETTPYLAFPLPEYVRAATFRVPELETRKIGNDVNEVLSDLEGILGGTIRARFISVDFDERKIDAETIAKKMEESVFFDSVEFSLPANDDPAPENSAAVVIRIPDMVDHATAASILDYIVSDALASGAIDINAREVAFIYKIEETTAQKILAGVRESVRDKIGDSASNSVEIVTVDKADKPEGFNRNGLFVVLIAFAALAAAVIAYIVSRKFAKKKSEISALPE